MAQMSVVLALLSGLSIGELGLCFGLVRSIALKSYMTMLHCLANEIYLQLLG